MTNDERTTADDPARESAIEAAWEEAIALRERGALDPDAFRRAHQGYADAVLAELAFLDELREQSLAGFQPDPSKGDPLEEGRIGDYELERELGRGGQGIVYLARDTKLGRPVALKMLTEAGARSEFLRQRFKREAEAASRLDHPGICSVYAIGEHAGMPYIAMRYVEGEPLVDRMRRVHATDARPPSESGRERAPSSAAARRRALFAEVEVVEKAARALHVAHETGLVHRDVKPGNIVVTPDDDPVLLDFGLAHDASADAPRLTLSGHMIGTPAYMAPEQIDGHPADRRTDTYALGVTLYECLTGRLPFSGPTRDQLCAAILHQPPPDPSKLNPAVPRDLAIITEVALDKDPDRRYATAEAFAEDLRRVRASEPIRARPPGTLVRLQRWTSRRPALAVLAVVLLVGLPALTALVVDRWQNAAKIAEADARRFHEEIESALEEAFLALGQHEGDDAITRFEAVLARKPDSIEAAAGLVRAGKARDVVDRAVASLIEHPELMEHVFRYVKSEDRPAPPPPHDAIDHFLAALGTAPRCSSEDLEGFARAADHAFRAVLLAPEPRALYFFEWAHYLGHARDERRARLAAEIVRRRWPDSFAGNYWAAFALSHAGAYAEAVEYARRALALGPDRKRVRVLLADCLVKLGRPAEAVPILEEALERAGDTLGVHQCLANALIDLGRREDAITRLRQMLERWPEDHVARLQLALTLEQSGRVEEAIGAYREAERRGVDSAELHFGLGIALSKAGRREEAMAAYRTAIERDPKHARAHTNLGLCFARGGDEKRAIACFRTALRADPTLANAHLGLGLALARARRDEDAVAAYRAAIRHAPEKRDVGFHLGLALDRLGRADEAIAAYRRAIRVDPKHAEPHLNLAALLLARGRYGEALTLRRRGHLLGSRRSDWNYDSLSWVRKAERRLLRGVREAVGGSAETGPDGSGVRRAAGWMEALLAGYASGLETGVDDPAYVKRMVLALGRDAALRVLRPGPGLDGLPAEARSAWERVWKHLDALRARLE